MTVSQVHCLRGAVRALGTGYGRLRAPERRDAGNASREGVWRLKNCVSLVH